MKKIFFLLFCVITQLSFCPAQETGCFNINTSNELELTTSIDFSKYNAFFVGEFHGVYGVSEIKLALIKYLSKRYGITDVFMETSYSAAYLYNAYLRTGDTFFLKNPMLIYYMKKPYRDFWEQLYEYNKTLEHKITIHGMDFERIEFLKALKLLMPPGKEKPKEILPVLRYIDTVTMPELARVHSDNSYSQNDIYENIRDSIASKKDLYQQYFGDNFKTVEDIMFNADTYKKFDNRNRTMYNNMMKQIKRDKIEKFITINGMNHGSKSYQGWRSLCYRLAKTKQFKGKLADIALVCKNCYDWQLQPAYRYAPYRGPAPYSADTALINNIFGKYDNTGCRYTLLPADVIQERKVTRFSDYIILMKDQPEF